MEKTFLKIARVSLIFVIACSLLVTVAAAIFGSTRFIPSQLKTPEISIKYTANDPEQTPALAGSRAATSDTKGSAASAHFQAQCHDLIAKLNKVNATIGWDKETHGQYNPATMLYEQKTSVDYTSKIANEERFRAYTRSTIDENNQKLASYFKKIDLTDTYFANFNGYLDALLAHAPQETALAPEDVNRHLGRSTLEWFNTQFASSVDAARENAIETEARNTSARATGLMALYVGGCAFLFFFSCCLILVFIRIEVNTRELAGIAQTLSDRSVKDVRELVMS